MVKLKNFKIIGIFQFFDGLDTLIMGMLKNMNVLFGTNGKIGSRILPNTPTMYNKRQPLFERVKTHTI